MREVSQELHTDLVEPSLWREDGDMTIKSCTRSSRHFSSVQIESFVPSFCAMWAVRVRHGTRICGRDKQLLATPPLELAAGKKVGMEDLIDLEGEGNWDPKQSSQRTGKEPMLPERLDGSEWPLGDSVKICSKASATDVQLIGDVFSRSMPPSFSDTPTSGMKSKLLLSEALEGSHWAKKEEGSINKTTTPENDWANFSPVNSSTRHHHHHHLTIDTSNWVQTVTESSGEDPVIITDTSTGADDGLVDASPGWQAFSTGEEEASHTPTDWHELSTNTGRERSLLTTADSDRSVVEPPVFNTVDSTDSLYHSCATIFANSFTRGQQLLTNDNDREQRETCRAEKRENGAGHLSRDCDSDWQWIKDEG